MEARLQTPLTEASHWDKLPPEIKDKIEKLAARQLHQERLDQVCFVCHTDDVGVPLTPCCQKPAHYECCPAPIHLYQDLRSICMILDLDGYRVSQQPFLIREVGWCDMKGQADSIILLVRYVIHSCQSRINAP